MILLNEAEDGIEYSNNPYVTMYHVMVVLSFKIKDHVIYFLSQRI